MTSLGTVAWVDTFPANAFLVSDVTAGSTALTVEDASSLPDAGQVEIGDAVYDFTLTEDSIVTIAPALTADMEEGTSLQLVPDGAVKLAGVVTSTGDGDSITCRVPFGVRAYRELENGPRQEGSGETVAFESDETVGGYVLVDLPDEEPSVEGSRVFGPLPNAEIPPPTPVQPTASPTPTTVAGLRQVFVKYEPVRNDTLVTYEVHVTDQASAPAPEPGSAATLYGQSAGTLMAVTAMPNGTPLEYDVTYYFSIIAKSGDLAAPASPWVAGQMDRAAAGDLVAGSVTTELLDTVLAIVGMLRIGGELIELSPPTTEPDGSGGFQLIGGIVIKDPANPDGKPLVQLHPLGCSFRGELTADIVTVLYDLVINGNARISAGSTVTLVGGIPDPIQGPSLTSGSITHQAWPGAPSGYTREGLAWDATNSRWIEVLKKTDTLRPYLRTVSTAGAAGTPILVENFGFDVTGERHFDVTGIAVIGSSAFVGFLTNDGRGIKRYYVTKCAVSTGANQSMIRLAGTDEDGYDYGVRAFSLSATQGGQVVTAYEQQGLDQLRILDTSLNTVKRIAIMNSSFETWFAGGVFSGSADFGADRVVGLAANGTVRTFTPTWSTASGIEVGSLVAATGAGWNVPGSFNHSKLIWNGANFLTQASGASSLQRWSGFYPGAADGVWSAVYADRSSAGTTAGSPASTVTVPARHFVIATLPDALTTVVGSDLWVGYAASGDAATKYKRAEALSGRTVALTAGKQTSGATTIPTTNTAGGAPAKMQSQGGASGLRGDGKMWAGVAPVDPTDVVRLVDLGGDTGWVNITLESDITPRSGFTPQVRRIGKQVFVRGSIVHNFTNQRSIGNIPDGFNFRPSQQYDYVFGFAAPAVVEGWVNTGGTINVRASSVTGSTVYVPLAATWAVG